MTILTGTCGVGYSRALTGPDTCQVLTTGSTYSVSLPNTSVVTYYLIWDGNGGAECSYCVTVNNVIVLPVELLSFDVKANQGKANISWKTATESNNNFFTIEKSKDAINYEEFKTVPGAGNSTISKIYSYIDNNPYPDVSYYRLKQTDYNGAFKYSKAIIFNRDAELRAGLKIVPNPATKEITLQYNCADEEIATIIIYDSKGIVVENSEKHCLVGKNSIEFDLSNYTKGIYFITFSTNTKNHQTRFVKN
ncbi:MAG TPA: T9SS type A sorting domain-containing protein [Bacteroidia bacterium]|jgi:hypothetical protein|nr:T9SS type A sorting domain-containing protein [Bacteroidia bacterium]